MGLWRQKILCFRSFCLRVIFMRVFFENVIIFKMLFWFFFFKTYTHSPAILSGTPVQSTTFQRLCAFRHVDTVETTCWRSN